MKKLPFDLAKALAGAKLVTREGKPALNFRKDPNPSNGYNWRADVGSNYFFYKDDGRGLIGDWEFDLFLLDESDQPAPEVAPVPQMPMVFPPWLTERKFYAACALQGLMSYPESGQAVYGYHAEQAVKAADALIAELNKEKK